MRLYAQAGKKERLVFWALVICGSLALVASFVLGLVSLGYMAAMELGLVKRRLWLPLYRSRGASVSGFGSQGDSFRFLRAFIRAGDDFDGDAVDQGRRSYWEATDSA